MKVLGVGLSKTGTTSLHRALDILGFRSLHYDRNRLNDIIDGSNSRPSFRRYDDVDAVVDLPAAAFYDELVKAYPDCKCILTIRDEDAWWRSMSAHSNQGARVSNPELECFRVSLRNYVYGSVTAHEFLYRKKYREHNERVVSRIPFERLLVMDISAGDGWESLCPFLDREIPLVPFPHENKAADYHQPLGLARRELVEIIPRGAAFILVDEDQLRSDLLRGYKILPFLERDGGYWGPPADHAAAIREFDRLRLSGAGFMVFAWPAFWWLEFYSDLSRYLRSRFPCVLENERWVVFDLLGPSRQNSTRPP